MSERELRALAKIQRENNLPVPKRKTKATLEVKAKKRQTMSYNRSRSSFRNISRVSRVRHIHSNN